MSENHKGCGEFVEECATDCGDLFDCGEGEYIRVYCPKCRGGSNNHSGKGVQV